MVDAPRADRPRLLAVASTFPAREGDGTPEFIRDLSLRLAETFDTVLLVPRVSGAPAREQIGPLTVERFAYFPRRWESLAEGAIIENLRSKPTRWLQVVPFFLAESFRLRRLIRRHRPDVLHVHWMIPQGVSALVAGRSVPWLVTTHGGDVYALRDPISSRLKRAVVRRASAFTATNADIEVRLVELGADPERVHIQSVGADIDGFRRLMGDEEQVPGRILFVGRLVEKKGVAVLLDALRRLPDDLEWSLEIAGDGPLRAELEQQAAGLPVTFAGTASRAWLARAYARSSVVVVPSVPATSGDQDGLPTVLLEAMGAGRAAIASDLPGINEAVQHDETGLLVPPNDPDALADALGQVLGDDVLRKRLGVAAAERSNSYTVEACAARFVEILQGAARGRAR